MYVYTRNHTRKSTQSLMYTELHPCAEVSTVKQMREYLLEVIAYFIFFKNSFLHFFSSLFQRSVPFCHCLVFSLFFIPARHYSNYFAIIQTISSIIVFHSFIFFLLRSFIHPWNYGNKIRKANNIFCPYYQKTYKTHLLTITFSSNIFLDKWRHGEKALLPDSRESPRSKKMLLFLGWNLQFKIPHSWTKTHSLSSIIRGLLSRDFIYQLSNPGINKLCIIFSNGPKVKGKF